MSNFPPRVWVNLTPQDEDEEMLDCFLEKPIQGPLVWQSGFLEYVPASLLAQEKAAHEATKGQLQESQHFLGKAERRIATLEEENSAHEETKRELNSCKRSRGCKVADIERLKEENADYKRLLKKLDRANNSEPCEVCDRGIEGMTCTCWDYLATMNELRKEIPDTLAKYARQGDK